MNNLICVKKGSNEVNYIGNKDSDFVELIYILNESTIIVNWPNLTKIYFLWKSVQIFINFEMTKFRPLCALSPLRSEYWCSKLKQLFLKFSLDCLILMYQLFHKLFILNKRSLILLSFSLSLWQTTFCPCQRLSIFTWYS